MRAKRLKNGSTVQVATYGEYPQGVVADNVSRELETGLKAGRLKKTGKKYTFDSTGLEEYDKGFRACECPEYEFNSKKYIRVDGKCADSDSRLSNGKQVETGKTYWVEVSPIEWLVDRSGKWVAKKALFSGIRFNAGEDYDGNFSRTEMKSYLDKYFSNEMQADRTVSKHLEDVREEKPSKRRNGYGILVEDTPMPVKEQIDFYIQKGMSFMLHGPSGIGKTRRVEDIDPDLTAVPLYNGVLPEDIVGKVIYPSGAANVKEEGGAGGIWVEPDWYTELCRKCKAEPDKQYVLFIDEVTNARPTTQSLIFHIVLKKSISPSKGKLPDNSVVVLAGNSKEESGAAYNMPEPLFRRMVGHVHLEPNVPEWLEWASEKNRKDPDRLNIHPIVSSFVATYGSQVFYSGYDEENPQKWAIDPRGWEQVSDVIYNNKGVIRRELLESKMGSDLAASFLAYAKNPPLSMNEILEGEYNSRDIPDNQDAKLALALSLRYADEKQIGKVRAFIDGKLGKENLAVFDSVWVGKSEDRAMQMANMRYQFREGASR